METTVTIMQIKRSPLFKDMFNDEPIEYLVFRDIMSSGLRNRFHVVLNREELRDLWFHYNGKHMVDVPEQDNAHD